MQNSKPQPPQINVDNIPQEMKGKKRWINWKYEFKNDRWTKVPRKTNGDFASSTDEKTWNTFDECYQAHQSIWFNPDGTKRVVPRFDGLGFVLGEGIGGVDIDHCIIDGNIAEPAKEAIEAMGAYTEISPSGHGIRMFCRGTIPQGEGNKNGDFEVYSQGRFLTVTGNHLEGTPDGLEDRQDQMIAFRDKYVTAGRPAKTKAKSKTATGTGALDTSDYRSMFTPEAVMESIESDPKWGKLYRGDWSEYDSQSCADLAMCSHIASIAGPDVEMVDCVYRLSGLMRDKWERDDYRNNTIAMACEGKEGTIPDEELDVPHYEVPPLETSGLTGLMTFDELLVRAEAMKDSKIWAADKWIQVGKLGLLSGQAKKGKSTCVFDLATAIATGTKWIDCVDTIRMPVLLVDYENEADYQANNFLGMMRGRSLEPKDAGKLIFLYHPDSLDEVKPFAVHSLIERISQIKSHTGMEYGIFFVDTARPAFGGLFPENGDWEWKQGFVRKCMEMAKEVIKATGWGCVVIHHNTKTDSSPSGSGDWEGAVDYSINYKLDKKKWISTIAWMGRQTDPPNDIEYKKDGLRLVGVDKYKAKGMTEEMASSQLQCQIYELIKNGASTIEDIISQSGKGETSVRQAVREMVEALTILENKGPKGKKLYSLFN